MGFIFILFVLLQLICVQKMIKVSIIVQEISSKYLPRLAPSTLYFWGMLGLTSFIITPGQKQITKRYFTGYLFGIYGSICKKKSLQ